MTNSTHTTTLLDNIIAWIAEPRPVRHTTDTDGKRRLVYAQVDASTLETHECDTVTDADRLALHAGLVRTVKHRRLRFKFESTDVGRAVHRRLHGW